MAHNETAPASSLAFQVNSLQSSKVYSQVIEILKDLSATGNVQQSLQKIDGLINGLQSEMEEDKQPTMPLHLTAEHNPFMSPCPRIDKDCDPMISTCDQKKVFQQFSGASLNDLVVSKQLTKIDQKLQ